MRYPVHTTCLILICVALGGCGPSDEEIAATIEAKVAIAVDLTVAAIPTMTPCPTLTPYPTHTPTPTPIPTNTPPPHNVQGRLLWNDEPLPGADVKMTGTGEEGFFVTVTGELGGYTFLVQPGEYKMYYRFPGEIEWIASQATPYFSRYRYAEWPIVVEEGKTTFISDIHTIKENDLEITFPEPYQNQVLPPNPTFKWEEYPFADYYQVWVYEMHMREDVPAYSYPAGAPAYTRATTITLDWSIPVYNNYYIWVIAYNGNGHELADGRAGFAIGGR
jgi:hypothetical protein